MFLELQTHVDSVYNIIEGSPIYKYCYAHLEYESPKMLLVYDKYL
jgi:hypothetical protein